jgi:hypothetical protein
LFFITIIWLVSNLKHSIMARVTLGRSTARQEFAMKHLRRRTIQLDEHRAANHDLSKYRRQEGAAADEEDAESNVEGEADDSGDDSEGSDAEGSSSDDGEESSDSEDSDDEEEAPTAPQPLDEASPFSDPTMQRIESLGPLPIQPPRNVRLSIRHDKIKRKPRSTLASRQAPAVPLPPPAPAGVSPPVPGVTAPPVEDISSESSDESDGITSASEDEESATTTTTSML